MHLEARYPVNLVAAPLGGAMGRQACLPDGMCAWMQTAGRDITELEVLKVTLQPKDGIWMLCKPRG